MYWIYRNDTEPFISSFHVLTSNTSFQYLSIHAMTVIACYSWFDLIWVYLVLFILNWINVKEKTSSTPNSLIRHGLKPLMLVVWPASEWSVLIENKAQVMTSLWVSWYNSPALLLLADMLYTSPLYGTINLMIYYFPSWLMT